jgi:hypothetical protein
MKALLAYGSKDGSTKEGNGLLNSRSSVARLAGLFYLIFILTFVLAAYVRSQIIVSGDAAATAHNISTSELLFRSGFVIEIVSALFFVLAAWALYVLLKPVNKDLALLFLLLNLGGAAVECINMLNLFAAIQLLSGADYLNVFSADQLQAQALSYLDLYASGIVLAQIFFAAWLLPLGYLVYRSGFLPKLLGILLIIDFFGDMSWFLQFFMLPGYPVISYPGLALSFIAEISLTLWLLFKGVKGTGQASTADG